MVHATWQGGERVSEAPRAPDPFFFRRICDSAKEIEMKLLPKEAFSVLFLFGDRLHR